MDLSTAVSLQAGGGQRRQQQHSSRGLTFQAPTIGIKAVGSSGWSSNKRNAQRLSLSAAQYDTAVTEDQAQDQGVVGEQQEDFAASKSADKLTAESVMVEVEKTQRNGRQLQATIKVAAPLRAVWSCLTDYANLAEFIPSLAQNTVLQERSDGARLEQIGEQSVALGIKFRARVIVDVQESAPPTEDGSHDIRFDMIEGDFQEFSGVWSMEQNLSSEERHTLLKYSVLVRPQRWLPVALVEGRIKRDMQTNLVAVAAEAVARARNSDGVRVA